MIGCYPWVVTVSMRKICFIVRLDFLVVYQYQHYIRTYKVVLLFYILGKCNEKTSSEPDKKQAR